MFVSFNFLEDMVNVGSISSPTLNFFFFLNSIDIKHYKLYIISLAQYFTPKYVYYLHSMTHDN